MEQRKPLMHPLDNVIWQALTTRQSKFAQIHDQARRFPSEVTTLAALEEATPRGFESLTGLIGANDAVILSLARPFESAPGLALAVSYLGLQMVLEDDDAVRLADSSAAIQHPITELGDLDSAEMVELAGLTRPGPFGPRTHELGLYLGIRSEGKLIAMAGERLKVAGHTEVSAVCTHPEHTGQGYARRLMLPIMKGIIDRGEIPFLHVRQTNDRAIQLYERLGFRTRMVVHFTVLWKA
jgi:ribosomal protein S18 acetylase RimI-like enzyme